jgi:predicted nucleotidyltransferase
MNLSKELIHQIKQTVHKAEPGAEIILFGSYARGDNNRNSDIDLLILSDKTSISDFDKKKIIYELYDVELDSGYAISSVILSKKDWKSKHAYTPFFFNVNHDGIIL